MQVRVSQIKIQQASAPDWPKYLKGVCELTEGNITVYAHFRNENDEKQFFESWTGQEVMIVAARYEMIEGIGLRWPRGT